MKRREFITLIGGAAGVWPLVVRAQQAEQMRRIGVLSSIGESDYRWAEGDADRYPRYAAELVSLGPET